MRSLREALELTGETDDVAFARAFDPGSAASWVALVKDVVAMANSGGGIVLIGAADELAPSAAQLTAAQIDEKVHEYTGSHLAGVRVVKLPKAGRSVLAIEVEAEPYPVVFVHAGDSVFALGSVFFRRDARSEPGTVEDIRRAFEREIARRMDGWLANVRRVVEAPPGSVVSVGMPTDVATPGEPGLAVRLVSDPHAPAVPRWSPDETHPHRLRNVVALVNERLAGRAQVNAFDLQCVRRVHETDRVASFFYRSNLGGPQYSDAFVDWLVEQFGKNPAFFVEARARAPRFRHRGR